MSEHTANVTRHTIIRVRNQSLWLLHLLRGLFSVFITCNMSHWTRKKRVSFATCHIGRSHTTELLTHVKVWWSLFCFNFSFFKKTALWFEWPKKWFYSIVLSFFYSFVSLSLSTHQHVQFVVVKQTVSANFIRFAIMFSNWYDVVTLLTWIVIIHPFSILVWWLFVAAQMATEKKCFAKFLSRFCWSFYLICRKYPEKIANFWASVYVFV